MDCPRCGSSTRVLESRRAEDGAALRRRRLCRECEHRFTTFERREAAPAWVLKRGGERQPFDAEKLRGALHRAAHKRPVTDADLDSIVRSIQLNAEDEGGELSSDRIRELCLEGLSEVDTGAYLQFAGVELSDPDEVRATLERLGPPDRRKDRDFSPLASVSSVRGEEEAKRPTEDDKGGSSASHPGPPEQTRGAE